MRKIIFKCLQYFYRALPFREDVNIRIAHFAYKNFPQIFKGTAGYENWLQSYGLENEIFDRILANPILEASQDLVQKIAFAKSEAPKISIIIPVYGKLNYTAHCLISIQKNAPTAEFEIIIIDDCSSDNTYEALSLIEGLVVIKNESNLGFLLSCNKGAEIAKGRYLHFLNNDTEVQSGWLDELLTTLENNEKIGMVGSCLIYPNGQLQEAGGIIWSDASGMNYGREDEVFRPEYRYMREVDYCSGASILISKELFQEIGSFDTRYSPAYYEDTDLAFSVRSMGYAVVYQPFSKVIHFEGITSGTDISVGVKSYQVVNQKKFLAKWQSELNTQQTRKDGAWISRDRSVNKRALVLDFSTPKPDKDSGSIDTVNYLHMLQSLGYKVVFCPNDLLFADAYTEVLQRDGIECLYHPYVQVLKKHLQAYGEHYDLVMLHRAHFAIQEIDNVRKYCPNAKIVFNTVDLHFIREERQATVENSAILKEQANKTKAIEREIMRKSDATIVISSIECEKVLNEWPEVNVVAIPYIREASKPNFNYTQRKDIVFIGGFLFEPNVDAVSYFINQIWPMVKSNLPDANLLIVGSDMPARFKVFGEDSRIKPIGYVEDLERLLEGSRLTIAPLRFGAGLKGKIGTSLSHGVPCVATELAIEGIGLTHGESVMIGNSPEVFAESVIECYQDQILWERIAKNGYELFSKEYSYSKGLERFSNLIKNI